MKLMYIALAALVLLGGYSATASACGSCGGDGRCGYVAGGTNWCASVCDSHGCICIFGKGCYESTRHGKPKSTPITIGSVPSSQQHALATMLARKGTLEAIREWCRNTPGCSMSESQSADLGIADAKLVWGELSLLYR